MVSDVRDGRSAHVTYDICQDKRLARVHKTMRGFGDHLQYSVFECQLTPARERDRTTWRAAPQNAGALSHR